MARAVANIVEATPWAEHHLLWSGPEEPPGVFAGRAARLGNGPVRAALQVRRAARAANPDVVHLHSSLAGAVGRIALWGTARVVVYQPHGYAHEDETRGVAARHVYRMAERILARVGRDRQVCAVVGRAEADAAARLGNRSVVVVPNVPTVPIRTNPRSELEDRTTGRRIVMIGRIAPQKDPQFFASVARATRCLVGSGSTLEFVWVGDGEPRHREVLAHAGVRVTGWLKPDGVRRELDAASVYFHCAAFEGYPIAVLDARARRVPVVVRDIRCFAWETMTKVHSVDEAAQAIARALAEPETVVGGGGHVPTRVELDEALRRAYGRDA
ncbi:glycosyltransferase [Demequina sp. NBRC 110057]|uniref:glycosyltransferase n=1 Tax=Demequina sp. NBRC 110057 TaxID=1570346 RepID=UPI0013566308|nr:glycosyltransferase [Demequina sp. NBRC 110057]